MPGDARARWWSDIVRRIGSRSKLRVRSDGLFGIRVERGAVVAAASPALVVPGAAAVDRV